MKIKKKEYLNELLLFHPYLKKKDVNSKLQFISKYPDFNKIYTEIRENNKNANTSTIIAKTLQRGIDDSSLTIKDIDELLFLLIEDSLFNSFLYKLDNEELSSLENNGKNKLFKDWKLPNNNEILSNLNLQNQTSDFVICGYREQTNEKRIESLRILLLDTNNVKIYESEQTYKDTAFPTIVEIDFLRNLLHIRLKDVDNIINNEEKISTMSGRILNTLNFIDSFKPNITYSKFNKFRESLFKLEENLLHKKRNSAYKKLETFNKEIVQFSKEVEEKFSPPTNSEINTKEYISNGVLSVIATTLSNNEIGDIVGIKFRNNNENDSDKKYAEITINDKGFKCISTNNLYWLNLPVLLNRKKIEFLKVSKNLANGIVIANLEFVNETANVRILQKSSHDNPGKKATQEKYDDFINYLNPFL
ncbi:hypothetical protein AQ616_17800 [Oceanobacillus sp. E9]|uniref:hypothetical protein n=1 Tax=Oceanobacillus sp. E9 TaxID=1742575 RepID=UPI00084E5B08|nr:hypothetical protein [Oceanobacillus sp. E9]OEH53134.1 hypothetical protein AQ616_17800 [Oceanobacillus sp. E9]